jgi:NAD(P)-dependent dehydrogenase (short-subunit alcohol dehydrogenase family)
LNGDVFVASKGIVLVAGAGGLVGRATIDQYFSEGEWDVIGLSRRPPQPRTGAVHVAVDLSDAAACNARLGDIRGVTHILYGALFEKADLTPSGSDRGQHLHAFEPSQRD